jgi:NitT/TauT family transport system substrate-binding protein
LITVKTIEGGIGMIRNRIKDNLSIFIILAVFSAVFVFSYGCGNSRLQEEPRSTSQNADIAVPQAETQKERTVIKIGYRPISPSIDFFVAMDRGYFEEAGLKVDPVVFRGSSDLVDALMAGKVDFASDLGMITQLMPMLRTGESRVKFLTLDLDAIESPMRGPTLVAKKEAGIETIEDLKGKNIGIFPDINFKIFLEAMLKKHFIDIDKDVTVTQIPPQEQIAAFTSVDALLSLDPIISGIENQFNAVVLADRVSARYIFDNFPAAASSVNTQYARANPNVVAKVVGVLEKGIDFVRENPGDTVNSLAKWTNLPVEIAQTMEPVKYAKHNEIDVELLQKTIDYLAGIPWLNVKQTIDAGETVWTIEQ